MCGAGADFAPTRAPTRHPLANGTHQTKSSTAALTLLALGIVRRRNRRKRPARDAIEAALEAFDTLGASGWSTKARTELGRISGRTRADGLTAAERRVAALVAEGKTMQTSAWGLFSAAALAAVVAVVVGLVVDQ